FHNLGTVSGTPVNNIPCTLPVVSITSPVNGSTISTPSITFTGTSSDSASTVQKVEVSIDGLPYALATGTTSWSYTVPASFFSNGVHMILARATDNAGNVGFSYSTNTQWAILG